MSMYAVTCLAVTHVFARARRADFGQNGYPALLVATACREERPQVRRTQGCGGIGRYVHLVHGVRDGLLDLGA
jgi:hypothetical protein